MPQTNPEIAGSIGRKRRETCNVQRAMWRLQTTDADASIIYATTSTIYDNSDDLDDGEQKTKESPFNSSCTTYGNNEPTGTLSWRSDQRWEWLLGKW